MVQTASTASRSIRTRFLAAAACLAVLVVIGMHRSAPSGASVAWPSSAAKLAGSWQSQTTCDHGFTPQQLELLKQLLESSGVTGSAATMDTAPTRANAGSSTPTTDGQESEETEPDSDDLPEPGPEPTDAAHARAWKELVRQGRDAKKEMRAAVQLRGARGECERPRAIAGYLDVSSNGREEFTHFAHASWRRIIKVNPLSAKGGLCCG
ncbi:unnamed protein product [Pedinophyceae sp. YPF-701]|nr:unnamed protein product [Pedinophyceae sp. YPF-701]